MKKKAPLVRRMKEVVKTESVVWGPLDHNLFFDYFLKCIRNYYGIQCQL